MLCLFNLYTLIKNSSMILIVTINSFVNTGPDRTFMIIIIVIIKTFINKGAY